MKQKLLSLALITGLILFWGCDPEGAKYYDETDIVYTDYDDNFKFETTKTYAIPDKIIKITGNLIEGEDPEFVKEPLNTEMLQRMESNMAALGYTKVATIEQADLTLFPAVWTNTTIYFWYDYWCWWNPYYCGWGWGYPSFSKQTTGTLVMGLIVDGEEYVQPTRVWTGAANGLLSGSYNTSRVNNAIDQAFKQSPYLKTN